jgi:hypothetical protein
MGGRFWLGFIGILLAGAVAAIIGLSLFGAAIETWGLFGAILLLCGVFIALGWVIDRRRGPRPERI